MAKGFSKNNPLDKLSGTSVPKSTDSLEEPKKELMVAVETKPATPETQQNKSKDKKGQKYLRLDITDYQDYISLMADHLTNTSGKYTSMTQYILRLIEADKQQNIAVYEKLEQIEKMKRELI